MSVERPVSINPGIAKEHLIDVGEIEQSLRRYGEENGIRGLEGRVSRGLDPVGMLAVPETRAKVEALAKHYGADMGKVTALTNALHQGGVWEYAPNLAAGSPEATVWIVAGEATVRDKENKGDLSQEEFAADYKRVNVLLDVANADPASFAQTARKRLLEKAAEQFTVDDGVPVSDMPEGFLAMAVSGYKGGVVTASDGLHFVGAHILDFDHVAQELSLERVTREDRGREATFYVDVDGKNVIKQLYPGFGIVLTGDMETAKLLASTAKVSDTRTS